MSMYAFAFFHCVVVAVFTAPLIFVYYSNPSKYTSLRAAEKVVHFEFVYIGIEYT